MAKPIESDENKMSCRVATSPGSSFAILPVPAPAKFSLQGLSIYAKT